MLVSRQVERRFVLGRQGLWPGRRHQGPAGLADALEESSQIQVDPIDVVGRSHDIAFASRVLDYRPEDLDRLLYEGRGAYEYGGSLFIFPRRRLAVELSRLAHLGIGSDWEQWGKANRRTVVRVRNAIRAGGPVDASHWKGGTRVEEYRSRRAEGMALHYLWRRLEIVVHHRSANRKFYDLRDRVFPGSDATFAPADALREETLARTRWLGLSGRTWFSHMPAPRPGVVRDAAGRRGYQQQLIDDGYLARVQLESEPSGGVLAAQDLPMLEQVVAGDVPRPWKPLLGESEAIFLAPLEVVSARDRARRLFDFEYKWEIYKPAEKRRWGYYVLPVLLEDRLIGRIEPVRDQQRRTLVVKRAWWETGVNGREVVVPLARGLRRMADRLTLPEIRLGAVGSASFRTAVREELARAGRR
ncbi:MAG: winged helix DNA-binding domain-containing protein [Thermoplasmata archaeon]|nr:winged helix DNA-binding domain-containing protein [Thermoplasmata archaeon]